MNTTFLMEIHFPAYKLPSNPTEDKGVRFFETYAIKTEQTTISIVDDLNIRKPTLGLRRLVLAKQNKKLFKFKTAVYSIGDLVRLNTADTMWIDSTGKVFKLPKTTKFNLEFRKIKQTFQKVGYVILDLEGEVQRFRSIYGPPSIKHGAVIMYNGNTRLFYGYALPEAKMTYKKV